MEVFIQYSEPQLEAAAKFISENNQSFLGQLKHIREHIRKSIWEMAEKFPHLHVISTMGYTILGSADEVEGIDDDVNILHVQIMVDPSLAQEPEYTEITYIIPKKAE